MGRILECPREIRDCTRTYSMGRVGTDGQTALTTQLSKRQYWSVSRPADIECIGWSATGRVLVGTMAGALPLKSSAPAAMAGVVQPERRRQARDPLRAPPSLEQDAYAKITNRLRCGAVPVSVLC